MHFNSAGENVPVFDVGGATLHHKDSFRYLGMVFYRTLNMANLRSLRRILGVKNSTTNWAVLRECGQEPLQIFGSVLPSDFLIACLIPTV